MADKINFQGIKIGIAKKAAAGGGTVTYTPIGCITDYSMSGAVRSEIDVTCSADTSKTYAAGLKDNGALDVSIFANFEGAGWKLLEEALSSPDNYLFQIIYPNAKVPATGSGTEKTFEGLVMSLSESGSVDSMITGQTSIKITGDITTVPAK